MIKKGVNFIFLIAFTIFLIGFVSSASCSITTSCASSNIVMRLSSSTNAHGALWDGTYTNYLCCDFTGTHTCSASNTVLRLSSSANAHAEIPSGTNYASRTCFGTMTCYNTAGSCTTGDTPMVSLSSTTNAHIGGFNDYAIKICCSPNLDYCGNGVIVSPETCDDGNVNSGDGCSYPTCAVESSYTCNGLSPTCCYNNAPASSWLLNGAAFSGGNIKAGDVLTMRFNEDSCFASGTSITFSVYEGATVITTATGTVTSGTPGSTSATYTVTSSFLTALGGASNIFFRITTPGTRDSATISVTPVYCGDGTCNNGETCSTCVPDCGCTASQECSAGSCIGLCDLTSASWSTTGATTGEIVRLYVYGDYCDGKQISFTIMEKDALANPDDPVTPNPANIPSYSSSNPYVNWNAVFQDDTDGGQSNPPEYYFTASVVGYPESVTSPTIDSLMLKVVQPISCGDGVCDLGGMFIANFGNGFTKINLDGTRLTYSLGINNRGIGFDGTNVWVPDWGVGSVAKVYPNGTIIATYTGVGANIIDMAFDGTNMWTANLGSNSVTKLTQSGGKTVYYGTGLHPYDIAFDGTNMWTANYETNSVTKISPTGIMTNYTGTGLFPYGIAFDGTNMWTANYNSNGVTKISPTGIMTNYTGTGTNPSGIAFDGTNMWTANAGNSVTRISPTGVMTSYTGPGGAFLDIAFDGTNMWATNGNGFVAKIYPNGTMSYYSAGSNPNRILFGKSETCSTCAADCGCSSGNVCSSGNCVAECILNTKYWNVSNTIKGKQVQLTVTGTNCNNQIVSFEILEDDVWPLADDPVQYSTNPLTVTMSGGQATTRWFAEWPGYGDNEQSPEYYFIPRITMLGKELTDNTPRLSVGPNLYCGDGIITSPETCDDGNAIGGDGCSSTCAVESLYSCTGSPSICSLICGNGAINSPEECDGVNLNGETCANKLGTGWTGTPNCNIDCTLNTSSCIAPPVCSISSAIWSTASAIEGDLVNLNVQTANCANGETISFVIKEYDSGWLDSNDNVRINPLSVSVVSDIATGNWVAEWQDDKGGIFSSETNPPEYLFTATILSNGGNLESSLPHMNVTPRLDAQCSGIGYCVGYTTKGSCETDTCDIGKNSVPGTVTCGGSYNSETGCYDYTNCGCTWNDISGECGPSWGEESSCGVCGNGIRDYPNERCDDGNIINGDGCSSICQFEPLISSPCTLGLSLCNDGTCSLNCYSTDTGVADCNYDNVCQSGEGCTCIDCQSEEDTCSNGLVCDIYNYGCCSLASNGVCDPYCSYVDPDCAFGARCGNGFKETGEECDLGIKNNIANSGCLSNCKLEIINKSLNGGCPEGTALCTDGTCSLNCYYTDRGVNDADFTQCQTGLIWSIVDQACCNNIEDTYCNEYCAYTDPDCVAQQTIDGFAIGTCSYTETSTDTCEDDNMLTRSLSATWIWNTYNTFDSNPESPDISNYWMPPTDTVYRYDPIDYSGLSRKSGKCNNVEDTLVCPASVQVPFFGIYSFVIAIIIVILIYIIYFLRKKNNSKNKKGKKK